MSSQDIKQVSGETADPTPGAVITIPTGILVKAQEAIAMMVNDESINTLDIPSGKVKRVKGGWVIAIQDWRR